MRGVFVFVIFISTVIARDAAILNIKTKSYLHPILNYYEKESIAIRHPMWLQK